jgi:hypothetical protein
MTPRAKKFEKLEGIGEKLHTSYLNRQVLLPMASTSQDIELLPSID